MQNRACRFGHNSGRNKYRQQSNFRQRTSNSNEGDRQPNHKRFNFSDRRRRYNHHQFNRSRNSHGCTQPFRSRGW